MSILRFFLSFLKTYLLSCASSGLHSIFFWRFVETINRLIVFLTAVSSRTHPEGIPKKSRG